MGLTDDADAEIVQAMWDLAIQLEDGTLADARKRLARAQDRLAEAMRDGASAAEIAELMQELRDATNDYMQMLADQMEPTDGLDQADRGDDEGQQIRRGGHCTPGYRLSSLSRLLCGSQPWYGHQRMRHGGAGCLQRSRPESVTDLGAASSLVPNSLLQLKPNRELGAPSMANPM